MALGVSSNAAAAEANAFKKVGKLLKGKQLVSPAGFDAGFPDFAYRIQLTSGKIVDLHYEYKADYKAQMGSMRDWIFNGRKFITLDTENETKEALLQVMNNTPLAVRNGKRLLNDLKNYFSSEVTQLYSGSLTVIKDKDARRAAIQEFVKNTANYQIAAISDDSMGSKIVDHYKKKFHKNLKGGSSGSILFMMLKDTIWMVDTAGSVSKKDMNEVAWRMNLSELSPLKNLIANLEVRIQPRGLSSPAKPVSIDVMASFRLKSAPAGGGKII